MDQILNQSDPSSWFFGLVQHLACPNSRWLQPMAMPLNVALCHFLIFGFRNPYMFVGSSSLHLDMYRHVLSLSESLPPGSKMPGTKIQTIPNLPDLKLGTGKWLEWLGFPEWFPFRHVWIWEATGWIFQGASPKFRHTSPDPTLASSGFEYMRLQQAPASDRCFFHDLS